MEPKEEDIWICEAGQLGKLYDFAHKRGTFLQAYQLSVSSVLPLQEAHLRCALTHLYRKCPNLRLCFGHRNGVTWLRQSVSQDIDFQIVNGIEADEIRDSLQTYQYNSETGPLWCARLLLSTKGDAFEMDDGFPHTSQIFIGMHHSISDGVTILKIGGALISLLNDVIAGNPIDDEEQIAHFASDLETEKLVTSKMAEIQDDPSLRQELSLIASDKGIGMPLLLSVLPAPEGGEDRTNNLTHILDEATTKQFLTRCKAERSTVHSAFTALANASIVSLLDEKDSIKDSSYRLCNGHVVNLRRYWPGGNTQVLGCHAHFPINLWTQVPKDITENFWDFARSLHQDLHHHLNNESILLREAYMKLNAKQEVSFDNAFFPSTPMQIDASFSNMGDITQFLPVGGPHVRPYLLIRQSSLHCTGIKNFVHFFHTFRGRLMLNFMYNTKFITKDLAEKHCSNIFAIMGKMISSELS